MQAPGKVSELDMAYEVQIGQAVTAGYFGGYSAKMQDIGQKELQRLQLSVDRKTIQSKEVSGPAAHRMYAQRLVKDLECKGIIRTAVECVNLALFANHPDKLRAECVRTFPSVHFPATLLLRREEM